MTAQKIDTNNKRIFFISININFISPLESRKEFMNTKSKTRGLELTTLQLTELAILLALVIALQSISSVGVVTLCLCLVPITLSAIVLDWKCGGILGFAFGLVALFWGIVGKDLFTLYLFQANPIMTILICIVKGALCGIVPAFVYNWLKKFNPIAASIAAAVCAPVVNTGIFALGCIIIQGDVITAAQRVGVPYDPSTSTFMALLFGVIITANFFIELLINIVFAPSLNKMAEVVTKRINIAK